MARFRGAAAALPLSDFRLVKVGEKVGDGLPHSKNVGMPTIKVIL
jgi:hypothetical protein